MNFKLLLPGIALAIFTTGCATTPTKPKTLTFEERFKKADVNQDGRVSREEYNNRMIEEAFWYFDDNGDGFVSEEEFVASGGRASEFRKIDKAKTGRVTVAEAKANPRIREAMSSAFIGADINRDGYVTYAEAKAYREQSRPYVR